MQHHAKRRCPSRRVAQRARRIRSSRRNRRRRRPSSGDPARRRRSRPRCPRIWTSAAATSNRPRGGTWPRGSPSSRRSSSRTWSGASPLNLVTAGRATSYERLEPRGIVAGGDIGLGDLVPRHERARQRVEDDSSETRPAGARWRSIGPCAPGRAFGGSRRSSRSTARRNRPCAGRSARSGNCGPNSNTNSVAAARARYMPAPLISGLIAPLDFRAALDRRRRNVGLFPVAGRQEGNQRGRRRSPAGRPGRRDRPDIGRSRRAAAR